MQFPGQFNALSLPAVDQAVQQKEYNALRNEALQQGAIRAQTEWDDSRKQVAQQRLYQMAAKSKQIMEQNPNSWVQLLPEWQQGLSEIGLPTDKIPPAGASPEAVMEGLNNILQASDLRGGNPQTPLTKNDLVPIQGEGGAVYTTPQNALGQSVPQTTGALSAMQKSTPYSVNRDGKQILITPTFNPNTGKVDLVESPYEGQRLSSLGETANERQQREIETAGGKKTAQGAAGRVQEVITQGQAVADGLPVLKRTLSLLDVVDTGGKLNEAQLQFAQALGVETADQGELSANLGKAVLGQLRETFGAQFTENEGKRLASIEAGFGKNNVTNKRLIGQAIAIAEAKANRAIKLARENGDEATAQIIEEMMSMDLNEAPVKTSTPSGVAPEGTVINGPNGAMIKQNGQWVPYQ